MLPNFNNKEQLIAESLSVKLKDLKRGDVIVFESPLENNKLLIKRVIGLPEENFKIVDGKVYINGNLLNEESYLQSNEYTFVEKYFENNIEYQIPNDSYVVLGDNRDESTDSREWGYVDIDSIIGKVIVKIYPLKSIGIVKRARY
jgi:signal peptidase I